MTPGLIPLHVIDADETEGALAISRGAIGVQPVRGASLRFWPRCNGRPVIPAGMPSGGFRTEEEALKAAFGFQLQARLYLEATGAAA